MGLADYTTAIWQGSCYQRCRRQCIGFQKLSQNKYIPKTYLPCISVLHIEYQTDGCENNAHCSNGVISDSQSKVKCNRDVPWCTIWCHPICGEEMWHTMLFLALLLFLQVFGFTMDMSGITTHLGTQLHCSLQASMRGAHSRARTWQTLFHSLHQQILYNQSTYISIHKNIAYTRTSILEKSDV